MMDITQYAYRAGFRKVAESYGVDPEGLCKLALSDRGRKRLNAALEVGGVVSPTLLGIATKKPMLGLALGAVNGIGTTAAAIRKTRSGAAQRAHDQSLHLSSLLPGVGAYNMWKRIGSGD